MPITQVTGDQPEMAQAHNAAGNGSPEAYFADLEAAVPLNRLKPRSEKIDCPYCKKKTQTQVTKTGVSGQGWLNFCCWPLPNRTHWFEWTHWHCNNCRNEVAKQKWGQVITVVSP